MRLYIKNKLVSLGGSSAVTDDNGNDVYKVKGKVFSITKKKKILDMEDKLLYTVCNKFFSYINRHALVYDDNGEKIAKITKKTWSRKNKYIVEGYKDEILIEGNFFSFNLKILKNGEEIGRIKKDFSIVKDSFVLEIDKEEEMAFMVALVIAIDNIVDKMQKE